MSIESIVESTKSWRDMNITKYILCDENLEKEEDIYNKILEEYKNFFFFGVEEDSFFELKRENTKEEINGLSYNKIGIKIKINEGIILNQEQKDKLYFLVKKLDRNGYSLTYFGVGLSELEGIDENVNCEMGVCSAKNGIYNRLEKLKKDLESRDVERKEIEERIFNIFYNGIGYGLSRLESEIEGYKGKICSIINGELELYKNLLEGKKKDFINFFEKLKKIEKNEDFIQMVENFLNEFIKDTKITGALFNFRIKIFNLLNKVKPNNFSRKIIDDRLDGNNDLYYYLELYGIHIGKKIKNYKISKIYSDSVIEIGGTKYIKIQKQNKNNPNESVICYISINHNLTTLKIEEENDVIRASDQIEIMGKKYIILESENTRGFYYSMNNLTHLITNEGGYIIFFDKEKVFEYGGVKFAKISEFNDNDNDIRLMSIDGNNTLLKIVDSNGDNFYIENIYTDDSIEIGNMKYIRVLSNGNNFMYIDSNGEILRNKKNEIITDIFNNSEEKIGTKSYIKVKIKYKSKTEYISKDDFRETLIDSSNTIIEEVFDGENDLFGLKYKYVKTSNKYLFITNDDEKNILYISQGKKIIYVDLNKKISIGEKTYIFMEIEGMGELFVSNDNEKNILSDCEGGIITSIYGHEEKIEDKGKNYIRVKGNGCDSYYISLDKQRNILLYSDKSVIKKINTNKSFIFGGIEYIEVQSINKIFFVEKGNIKNELKDSAGNLISTINRDEISIGGVIFKKVTYYIGSEIHNEFISFDGSKTILKDSENKVIQNIFMYTSNLTISGISYYYVSGENGNYYISSDENRKILKNSKGETIHYVFNEESVTIGKYKLFCVTDYVYEGYSTNYIYGYGARDITKYYINDSNNKEILYLLTMSGAIKVRKIKIENSNVTFLLEGDGNEKVLPINEFESKITFDK